MKNTEVTTPQRFPRALDWAITLVAAVVALLEALGQCLQQLRAAKMSLGAKLARGVAAVWVLSSRACRGVRAVCRQSA